MFAYIMAGGKGERLGVVYRPKPLTFIADLRMVEIAIRHAARYGFTDGAILMEYKASKMRAKLRDHLCDSGYGMDIDMISPRDIPAELLLAGEEPRFNGTAGSIAKASLVVRKEKYGKEPVGIFSGDILTDANYEEIIRAHERNKRKGAKATIGIQEIPGEGLHDFGVVAVNADGKVTAFQEKPFREKEPKPISRKNNLSIYILDSDLVERIQRLRNDPKYWNERGDLDFGSMLLPLFAKEGALYAHEYGPDTFWEDIGNQGALLRANLRIKNNVRTRTNKIAIPEYFEYDPMLDSLKGREVLVQPHLSQVKNSVLGSETFITGNCKIENVVTLGSVAIIGPRNIDENPLVIKDAMLDRYTTVHGSAGIINIHGTTQKPVFIGRDVEIVVEGGGRLEIVPKESDHGPNIFRHVSVNGVDKKIDYDIGYPKPVHFGKKSKKIR
jgi:glucose-1-phosphate adenylyltransferase